MRGVLSVLSPEAIGPQMAALAFPQPVSIAWPGANIALVFPFDLVESFVVRAVSWINGTVVSGNCDMGVYDDQLSLLFSIGSTAQSGLESIRVVNIRRRVLKPGSYFLAMAMDNTTGRTWRAQLTADAGAVAAWLLAYPSSFPLPPRLTVSPLATNSAPYISLLSHRRIF
jgi:hypothetical protein